jgi:hypothetical protein
VWQAELPSQSDDAYKNIVWEENQLTVFSKSCIAITINAETGKIVSPENASYENPHLHIIATDGLARVIYQAKDGNSSKTFLALDWLAQLVSHIPGKGEQMARYYGYYSNKSRGMRKKADLDEQVLYLSFILPGKRF